MTRRRSQAWADLERDAARALGGRRVVRPWTLFETRVDVEVPDFEWLRVDCKYRQTLTHHSMVKTIERKYCPNPDDVPVLVSRARGDEALATVPLSHYGDLLSSIRSLKRLLAEIDRAHCPTIDDPEPAGGIIPANAPRGITQETPENG